MTHGTIDMGKWAEDTAAQYLEKKSFKILFRNWRAERGDIDIIALDKQYLVFVEVKGGLSQKYGPPELRITASKKRQLYKLATLFIASSNELNLPNTNYRFDAVIVDGNRQNYKIRHYENAFHV